MSYSRMIVSTTNLARILNGAPIGVPVAFRMKRYTKGNHGILYVNGSSPGEAQHNSHEPFDDFDAPYEQVKLLAQVLGLLEEQPITLVWRGDRFILHHVSI